jgi:hypothetical protein
MSRYVRYGVPHPTQPQQPGSRIVSVPAAVAGGTTVTPPLIGPTAVLFTPTKVTLKVAAPLIGPTGTTFAPTKVALRVKPGFIGPTAATFSPKVTLAVKPGFIGPTGTLFAPTRVFTARVFAPLIGPSATLYAPTRVVSLVKPGLIGPTGSLFTPTRVSTVRVYAPLYGPTGTLYAPSTRRVVRPGFIGPTSTLFAPTKTLLRVFAPLKASATTLFAPTLRLTVKPGLIGPTGVLFAPTVSAGAALKQPPLIGPTSVLYAPARIRLTVKPGLIGPTGALFAPKTALMVSAPLRGPSATLFAPAIKLTVKPGFIGPTGQVFTPTRVTTSRVYAPLKASATTLFAPAVSAGAKLPPTLGPTGQTFAPTVKLRIAAPLIGPTNQRFAPTTVRIFKPAFIGPTGTLFTPTRVSTVRVYAPKIGPTGTVYAAKVAYRITVPKIGATGQTFVPLVVKVGPHPPLIGPTAVLYPPSIVGLGTTRPITKDGMYSLILRVEGSTTSIRKEGRWGVLTGLPEPVGASGTGPGSASAPALTGTEFDITDYGALINGTTDDSAAWVLAVAAAAAVSGTVLHPGGTSAVGTMIAVPSNVTVAGIGPSSVIKALSGLTTTYVFDVRGSDAGPVSVDNVTFRDLAFDLNSVSQAGAVVYRRNNNLLFDRCRFFNSAWYYIHESSGFADGLVPLADEVMVRDCTFDTHTGGSRECVLAGYVTNFTVLRCRFIGTNLGLSIYRAATSTLVQDCDFDTIGGSNPNAILYGRGCDNITVTNCSFTAVGTVASAAIRGCQPGDDYITGGGLGLPDHMENLTISHCTFTACGVAYQVGAVKGFRDLSNLVQTSLGTGVLVNSGNTSVNFAGYASRDLTFYGSEYLSNMLTGGTAAVFFNSTQAGVNLQMVARRNTFDDAGVTQTRAFDFSGNGTPAQSIFSGASIDTSNTSNVQLIRLLSTATGVTLENAGPFITSEGAWVPTITKRGVSRPLVSV